MPLGSHRLPKIPPDLRLVVACTGHLDLVALVALGGTCGTWWHLWHLVALVAFVRYTGSMGALLSDFPSRIKPAVLIPAPTLLAACNLPAQSIVSYIALGHIQTGRPRVISLGLTLLSAVMAHA